MGLRIVTRTGQILFKNSSKNSLIFENAVTSTYYSSTASDTTAAMLNNSEKVFWEFDSYYAKLELRFSIVLATTWPSYHVSAIKELEL